MPFRFLLAVIAGILAAPLQAAEPSLGPVIEGYGPTYPVEDRDVALDDDFVYRAVFDIVRYGDDPEKLNPRLVSVARYLNMHARNGVPVAGMQPTGPVSRSTIRTWNSWKSCMRPVSAFTSAGSHSRSARSPRVNSRVPSR